MPKLDANIPELPRGFSWNPHIKTDPFDMEFVIQEIDQQIRAQVIAARFETVAAVSRAVADGAAKIAGIIGGAKRG
jgi:hypothetical protein